MSLQSRSSRSLVRKREDTQLMPPPPPAKKIKRPRKILDEQTYTETLSHIIARDFFPGLLENETKQEYLDALDSKDPAWIASAGRRLQHIMTPGQNREGTVTGDHADIFPASHMSQSSAPNKLVANMTLSTFQSTYTSEDNESFYKLVDKQNQKRAEKYAWLWRGNKVPSKQMIKQKEVEDKIQQTRSLDDDGFKKDRLAIKDADDRPAQPDTWISKPRNGLMFNPDEPDDLASSLVPNGSGPAARNIIYENTRMLEPDKVRRPPSPTSSSIREAVVGNPRLRYQDSVLSSGIDTPKVNGYSFVDEEDEEEEDDVAEDSLLKFDLGPGDHHNPFRIQEQRSRETLHERMVNRISVSKKSSKKHGFTGRVEATPAPKFPSSSRINGGLTPAAQRLWNKVGTPKSNSGKGTFDQTADHASKSFTPSRSKSALR